MSNFPCSLQQNQSSPLDHSSLSPSLPSQTAHHEDINQASHPEIDLARSSTPSALLLSTSVSSQLSADESSVIIRRFAEHDSDQQESQSEEEDEASILDLAPEILIRIFTFLDPVSLARAAAVCRGWARVARDDTTWKSAFAFAFGLEAMEGKAKGSVQDVAPAIRRLNRASWKLEYSQRSALLRQWRKAKTPTVLSDSRISTISSISLSLQNRFMLSASIMYGVASRSDPFTGKVTKGFIDAAGLANGAGNGNPNIEFSPDVTALSMDADTSCILWGFRSGEVGMTILSRQGINPRGAIKSRKFSPQGCHAGPVTAIGYPFATGFDGAHGLGRIPEKARQRAATLGESGSTFVTAGYDGTVRLWHPKHNMPLWMSSASASALAPNSIQIPVTRPPPGEIGHDAITKVDYDPRNGVVAAGTNQGHILIWANINVQALLSLAEERDNQPQGEESTGAWAQAQEQSVGVLGNIVLARIPSSEELSSAKVIERLRIDPTPRRPAPRDLAMTAASSDLQVSVLVHHACASVFLRHDVKFAYLATPGLYGEQEIKTFVFGAPGLGEITCIRADFEPDQGHGVRSTSSTVPPSPARSGSVSPMLGATRSSSVVPHLVLGPSPFVTGTSASSLTEKKFVCAGTLTGGLVVWDWDAEGAPFDEDLQGTWQSRGCVSFRGDRQIAPALVLDGHHACITAIEITCLHILAGSSDGTVKTFCPLTGALLRTFNDRTATRHPARMLAAGALTEDEASRFRVTQIIAGNEMFIAAIGSHVLSWRAEPLIKNKDRKAGSAKHGSRAASRNCDPKFQMQVELRRALRESQDQLEAEREDRQANYERHRSKISMNELGDLSEQEAFEYAMMLSRDEEEATNHNGQTRAHARHQRLSVHGVGRRSAVDDEDLQVALEQIALAESREASRNLSRRSSRATSDKSSAYDRDHGREDLEVEDDSADQQYLHSSSSSPSPRESPGLHAVSSPSRAWSILSNAASSRSASASDRWYPNSKVRTVAVPRSARMASFSTSLEASPSLPPQMASPTDWPSVSPGNGAWSLGAPASATPQRDCSSSPAGGGYPPKVNSAHASPTDKRLGKSPSPSTKANLGAWNRSPCLRPASSSSTTTTSHSLLTTSLLRSGPDAPVSAKHPVPLADDEMDEDLRFAIELSLAEERSRSESQKQS
ncbi:hypothetical protein IE53DRAFT_368132 [Violaceomyces palustris]|uniref:Uncharacterized protein n=1 Tax=Violaceomyces palustris TaxID=1673888 RepID=A0ACD0NZV9_9BASI|nr:hypothetical protein IE53DRAFT_368132 [Violaceomyces palustris]